MDNHQCNESVKQKELLYSLPRKKISFSYGNLRFFQIINFKNTSFLLGQEVVQIKLNLVWNIPKVGRLWDKSNGPPNFSRKKFVFQSEISTFWFFYFQKHRTFIGSRSCSKWTTLVMDNHQCNESVKQREFFL